MYFKEVFLKWGAKENSRGSTNFQTWIVFTKKLKLDALKLLLSHESCRESKKVEQRCMY